MQENQKSLLGEAYFLLQGIGALLGWNAVLTAIDFFNSKYPNYSPDFTFSLAIYPANIILSIFMVYIRRTFSLNFRVQLCLLFMGFILISLPIEADFLAHTAIGFIIIMILLFCMATFNVIQQSSIAGIGSVFPSNFMGKYILGTGIAGFIISLLRIFILLAFYSNSDSIIAQNIEVLIYFGVSFIFAISCIFIHHKFIKTEICQYYLTKITNIDESPTEILLASSEFDNPKTIEPSLSLQQNTQTLPLLDNNPTKISKSRNIINSLVKFFQIFNEIKYFSFLMILTYTCTFMMFPGVMLKKKMTILNETWEVVLLIALYNFCDCVGKKLADFTDYYNKYIVGIVVIARFLLFIPFLLMALNSNNIPFISEDWFAFVNVAIFGITNGFPTSGIFILAPCSIPNEHKETGGFVILFSLQFGILCGTFLALLFKNFGE